MTYREYLKSDKWKEKRKLVYERALKNANSNNTYGICERCNYKPRMHCLQVHHKTYENLFNEPLEDLELLCPNCHKEETERMRQDKRNIRQKERILKAMNGKQIVFDIRKNIGKLSDDNKIVCKELNIVSWNDAEEVFDLRSWGKDADGNRKPLKGMTLSIEEVKRLRELLNEIVGA